MADKIITLENLGTFKNNIDSKYQEKLTASTIEEGEISKNIGFDSLGNIVKETPSESGVVSIGGASGAITLGNGLGISSNELSVSENYITNYEEIDRPTNLPTATITSPDFVQYNGKLYRKNISGVPSTITDLTGTEWELNNSLDFTNFPSNPNLTNINFTSNNENFTLFFPFAIDNVWNFSYVNANTAAYIQPYSSDTWVDNDYKIISFTGGTDVTNQDLITWLQTNARQILLTDLTNTS